MTPPASGPGSLCRCGRVVTSALAHAKICMVCVGGGSPERLAILAREDARPTVGRARRVQWGQPTPEPRPRRAQPEGAIKRAILDALPLVPGVEVWGNPRGMASLPGGGRFAYGFGPNGAGDAIGWIRVRGFALFFSVEVKTETGRATPAQVAWLQRVRDSGGVAILARSAEDAMDQTRAAIVAVEARMRGVVTP